MKLTEAQADIAGQYVAAWAPEALRPRFLVSPDAN